MPQIENNRQGYNFARNPSIPEIIAERSLGSPVPSNSSMAGGSNQSIPSLFSSNISSSRDSLDTISSETSSSGLYILPKEPSRPSSRNTCSDIHSEWTSTTSLDQEMDDTEDNTIAAVKTISRLIDSSDGNSSAEVQTGKSHDKEMDDTEDDTAATFNTISSSTDSGDKSSSAEVQAGISLDQETEDSEDNDLRFDAPEKQNQTGLKVSLRITTS